ncbi:hypothetical protein AB204_20505 [Xenorhabdus khoisanae]|uniref:Uncharacterized protein n=1 Tax=Xenorhabdus khoisanae TaxID=880157 RepID=A0A0J5FM35_9GAMM|nr:hypothetical protein AB204_20505 [Xenorhabdus khoisanae]
MENYINQIIAVNTPATLTTHDQDQYPCSLLILPEPGSFQQVQLRSSINVVSERLHCRRAAFLFQLENA